MEKLHDNKVISQIKESGHLPIIPKAFGEILDMLLDPYEYDLDECVDKFMKYPQLEQIMIHSLDYNSNLNRKILTIKDAITYLGARNAKIVAISYITNLLVPIEKGRAKIFNNKKYWKHCLGTSIAAYKIAEKSNLSDKDKMFIYGLVHDIGVTVLDICLPDEMDQIHQLQKKGVHQIAAEKLVLQGITHADIGSWLCFEWNLPNEMQAIIANHHTPLLAREYKTDVMIMHLADSISTNYYESLLGCETTFIYSKKIMESLGLDENFMKEIIHTLPQEIERLYKIIV